MASASRQTVSARSGAWAVAALVMTVSGVFSAWARLPACRRASSACASLCASNWLISSVSGRISAENHGRHAIFRPIELLRLRGAHVEVATTIESLEGGEERSPTPSAVKLQKRIERNGESVSSRCVTGFGDLKTPTDVRTGKDRVALGNPKLFLPRRIQNSSLS